MAADGDVAKHFLERVHATYQGDNVYDIVHYNDDVLPKSRPIYCRYYKFDPTSSVKLAQVFSREIVQVVVVMEDRTDALTVHENIRVFSKEMRIVFMDFWGDLELEDENTTLIDSDDLLANRLIAQMPDIPVVAQHVGMGQGEITEVMVPFGSAYAYRHISNVEQKNWRVAAIYRNNELLLPRPGTMIRPNDSLLLIGQPSILKNVYKAIKSEPGQFPVPYGKNTYLYIDMAFQSPAEVLRDLKTVLFLHRSLKNRLTFIKIVHMDSYEVMDFLRKIDAPYVQVDVAFRGFDPRKDLVPEIRNYNAGLVVVNRKLFAQKWCRQVLFDSEKVVLKLGEGGFDSLSKSAVLLSGNPDLEKISSVMFDLSSQLGHGMELFDVDPEAREKEGIIEHFQNLAEIFGKEIDVVTSTENPIRKLSNAEDFLQFIPFEEEVIKASPIDIFFPDSVEKYYRLMDRFHQIFIPV